MSRSGRVLKKSVKLLEMEDEIKPPSGRGSLLMKSTTPRKSSTSSDASVPAPIVSSDIVNTSATAATPVASPIKPETTIPSNVMLTPKTNNLKIKLNLSGDAIKLEPSPAKQLAGGIKMNLNSSAVTYSNANRLNPPIRIVTADSKTVQNVVFKVNPNTTTPTSGQKRPLETAIATSTADGAKKFKVEIAKAPEPAKPTAPVISTPKIVTMSSNTFPAKLDFPRKILIAKSDSEPFRATLSPIVTQTGASANRPQIHMVSVPASTLKPQIINTPVGNRVAQSITEKPKRPNQRARPSARQGSPAPSSVQSTSSARTPSARRAAKAAKETDADPTEKKKPAVSAYVLWCRESRKEMQSRYPDLNFIELSRKMGEFWHTLAQNEKDIWFKKAKLLTNSDVAIEELYTQEWISDDLKPKTVSSKQTLPITTETLEMFNENFGTDCNVGVINTEVHPLGVELIDVHAYLNILGDSLETIGSYLQRGVKYNSDIDYCKSTALSTLLDTALVAMGSLTCLTGSLPMFAANKAKLIETMENVSYFMPPTNLSYDA